MARLEIQLVPDSCWCSNLRSILSKKEWDIVRHDAYARAGGKCGICSRSVNRLEAHEKWEYDEDTHTQRLVDVVALCHSCHSVVHIGRTSLVGDIDKAEKWYMKVNECSYADYRKDLARATEDHIRRNQIDEWNLDISYLVDLISDAIASGRLDATKYLNKGDK